MYLAAHEKVLIHRRRQGKTQAVAAEEHGVPVGHYIRWENGTWWCPFTPRVQKLTNQEKCFIMRRRANMTQSEVANLLSCSTRWVTMMEVGRAPVRQLREFRSE